MAVLSQADSVPANQTITAHFGGIMGPLTGTDTLTAEIVNAFSGTEFNLQSVTIPTFSEFESPVLIGSFQDVDGGGHSNISGRNLTESEVAAFMLYRLQQCDGLYEAHVNKIETGAVLPSLFNSVSNTDIYWLAGLAAVLIVGFFALRFWPR